MVGDNYCYTDPPSTLKSWECVSLNLKPIDANGRENRVVVPVSQQVSPRFDSGRSVVCPEHCMNICCKKNGSRLLSSRDIGHQKVFLRGTFYILSPTLIYSIHLLYFFSSNKQRCIIIIIIQKICSAHISTLLGAQGANPETPGQAPSLSR